MAVSPIRATRMHMMPLVPENQRTSSRPIGYVCRRPVPGMVSIEHLPGLRRTYVYAIPDHGDGHPVDDVTMLQPVASVLGDNTQTLDWSRRIGGRVLQWNSSDTSDGYDIDWLNNKGGQGREMGNAWFWDQNIPEGQFTHNPTGGGSIYGADDFGGAHGVPFPGYSFANSTQGASITRWFSRDLGGGSYHTQGISIPFDFDSEPIGDSSRIGFGGGTRYDPLCYPGIRHLHGVVTNWNGNKGIHKLLHGSLMPVDLSDGVLKQCSTHTSPISFAFGFDELHFYDQTIGWTLLTDVNVLDGLASPSITSVEAVSNLVTITFAAPHGRSPSDFHQVTMAGWTDSSVNGTQQWAFPTTTQAQSNVSGTGTQSFTGGTVTSPDIPWASFSVTGFQQRRLWSDMLRIDESGGPLGGGITLLSKVNDLSAVVTPGVRHAVAHRALSAAGETWSFNEDFAVCQYTKGLSRTTDGIPGTLDYRETMFSYRASRGVGAPTNSEKDNATQLGYLNAYMGGENQNGEGIVRRGWYAETTFVITGTWAEVQAAVTTLDAEPDSIFDLNENL